MIELELLGLQPDGELLTLNDGDGNRYVLPVTDELRAALRRDRAASHAQEPERQMTPREIQARIREGLSVDEVCELSGLPVGQVAALAHPIMAEREYTARLARSFSINRDHDSLTIEELVASRLAGRGVRHDDIVWDSLRKAGEPWTLIATFVTAEREHRASWHVDLDRRALEALDDEGSWLSETQFPAPSTPWRAANTPPAPPEATQASDEAEDERDPIEDVLASLDLQRGRVKPMPHDEEEPAFAGAHPAASEPEQARDATILKLPRRSSTDQASVPTPEDPNNEEPEGGDAGDRSADDATQGSAAESPKAPDDGRDAEGGPRSKINVRPASNSSKGGKGQDSGKDPSPAKKAQTPETAPTAPDTEPHRGASFFSDGMVPQLDDSAAFDGQDAGRMRGGRRRKKRGSRPSMPSWDEIVFGKKD
ncbi:MAG: septation protein SepH [Actinomycetaceae bacterium]|nr:septation protein SepH [Actinomycetaceae bacterium]